MKGRLGLPGSAGLSRGSGHGCAPAKLDFPTLRWEFQTILTCHQVSSFDSVCSQLKTVKPGLAPGPPRTGGGTGPGSWLPGLGPRKPGRGQERLTSCPSCTVSGSARVCPSGSGAAFLLTVCVQVPFVPASASIRVTVTLLVPVLGKTYSWLL